MQAHFFDCHERKARRKARLTKVAAAMALAGVIGGALAAPEQVGPFGPFAVGVTYNKFQTFTLDVGRGTHQLQAAGHTLKAYLSNAVPSASLDAVKADLAEITAGNGYTAGGFDVQNDYTGSGGTATLTGVDITITASGGTIGPFQYVVLYNDTPTSPADPLISWWDYGSALTLNDGESFTIDFGASIFTLT